MKALLFMLTVTVIALGVHAAPVKTFRVEDYGAIADGKTDCGPAIRKAVSEAIASGGPAEVVIGPGRFIIHPENVGQYCVPVYKAKDLTIRGVRRQTELIITDARNSGFLFSECERVCLRDLAVDYNPPPFTQGRIIATDPEAGTFDLELDEGMPSLAEPWFVKNTSQFCRWGMIFDRKLPRLKAHAPDHTFIADWQPVRNRVWRLKVEDYQKGNITHMEIGDRFVHMARVGQAVVAITGSRHCSVENVTAYASSGLCAGLIGNEAGISLRRFQVRFRPGTKRLLTATADGVHCAQNRAGPLIESCYFEGMADDSVNIYCSACVITEVRSPTEVVASAAVGIRTGDRLQIFDSSRGVLRAEVKCVEVQGIQTGMLVKFDRPVEGMRAGTEHRSADHIYNVSAGGDGFVIRNCTMRNHRRHGLFIKASNGLITGNTLEYVSGLGMVIGNCAEWPEGPVPSNVVVRGNTFRGCGYSLGNADSRTGAALQVWGTKQGFRVADERIVRNIKIEGNRFDDSRGASIFLGAVDGARVTGNRFTADEDSPLDCRAPVILLDNCSGVVLAGNKVTDPRPDLESVVDIADSVEPGDAGVTIRDLTAQVAPGVVKVLDRRERQ